MMMAGDPCGDPPAVPPDPFVTCPAPATPARAGCPAAGARIPAAARAKKPFAEVAIWL
ncbi:MAG TPA: hypothetical protein VF606_08985 [Geminicoccaceae bacterium]